MFLKKICVLILVLHTTSGYFLHRKKFLGDDLKNYRAGTNGLKLTPLIQSGQLSLAKELSAVPPFLGNITSFSGFLTVNKTCDSNLFFWYFPAEKNPETAPVILWLQGGPGATSFYGLFTENGPYSLTPNNSLELREHPWTKLGSVLYIDNPVAVGYSYTNLLQPGCVSTNQVDVGANLYEGLVQFYSLFTELRLNPLYITGESYAGKYLPALGHAILKNNPTSTVKINLGGIAIGNGLIDPISQNRYGDFLYQLGLIDTNQREQFHEAEQHVRDLISAGKYMEANFGTNGIMFGSNSLFKNFTGYDNVYNFLDNNGPPEGDVDLFMDSAEAREALHVGNATWHFGGIAGSALQADMMQSVKPWVEELLENYRVMLYNGQMDLLVAYVYTENFVKSLNWTAAEEYKSASRHQWWVGNEIAGYVKKAGNLTEVVVRNSGHMVPADQPVFASDLISRFIKNELP